MSSKESNPYLSHSQASEIMKRLYGLTVSIIQPLPSYIDQNFYVAPSEGGEFLLKILNSADSQNSPLIEVQTHAMTFLHQKGFPVQSTLPTLTGQLTSLEEIDCGFGMQKYLVRLLTYLPGTTISKITRSPQILYDVGKMAATLDTILLQMERSNISVLQRDDLMWNLANIPLLNQYIHLMDGDPIQKTVKAVLEQYQIKVIPKLHLFRKCINHGDLNDCNLLVKPDGPSKHKISGILDFAHMSCGYFIFELAITIRYMMIGSSNPVEVAGPVVAGWESVFTLNEAERDSLYLLVLCRFCQSLVMGRRTVIQQPENEEYVVMASKSRTDHFCRLWERGKEEVEKNVKRHERHERIWFQSAAQFSQA